MKTFLAQWFGFLVMLVLVMFGLALLAKVPLIGPFASKVKDVAETGNL